MSSRKKIILASKSSARKELLMKTGIPFEVIVSHASEQTRLCHGAHKLVVDNALIKAKAVAETVKNAVVIGADTVVVCNRVLIGKPSSPQLAFTILRMLTRKPHWVYTGIAVIDVSTGAVYTDWCKTKVYMAPLSDTQIKRYIQQYKPLDKAGGFDIQGVGAIFIDRIEGCFYNVVGLPLSQLWKILQKLGIDIFKQGGV